MGNAQLSSARDRMLILESEESMRVIVLLRLLVRMQVLFFFRALVSMQMHVLVRMLIRVHQPVMPVFVCVQMHV